ncbi:hypothetical protein [Streptomyces sp. NPDC002994]|uniref:hypothetical protein n=1 Tax=Streptomyces sp. NPDC002994 TaxID=3154441 RepID=UPI0033B7D102
MALAPQVIKRKQRNLNRSRGIPNRLPATEAAEHIQRLRQTMSWADLRDASGCSAAHLRNIASGREPRINRHTHNKILTVQPSPRGYLYIDALGSRRRIQALMSCGHSQYVIAAAAGTTQYRIGLICNGQATVRLHLAQRITAAYGQLANSEGSSTRGRNVAAKNGWAGPDYWDDGDFDNPDFQPADGATPRYIVLAENGLELEQQGHTREQAAERLRVSKINLQQSISRYRKTQEAAA